MNHTASQPVKRGTVDRIVRNLVTATVSIVAFIIVVNVAHGLPQVNKWLAATNQSGSKPQAAEIQGLVNAERTKAGLPALAENEELDAAADTRCSKLVDENVYSHNLPAGYSAQDVAEATLSQATLWGENLAAVHNESSQQVVNDWMGSPSHKSNILDARYNNEGVAVCHSDNFLNQGSPNDIVVQEFAQL